MVVFRSTAALFATALSVVHLAQGVDASVQGSGSGSGTASTFHVLTGTHQLACTPKQVEVLKTRLAETVTLAKAASTALKVEGVEQSKAFRAFLGDANPEEMDAQHYTPVASIHPVDLKSVTSDKGHELDMKATAPSKETLFVCYPESHAFCSYANAIADRLENTVSFCPAFFQQTFSIDEIRAAYYTSKNIKAMGALVMLHELQHSASVVDKHAVGDLYIKEGDPKKVVPRPQNPLLKDQGVIAVGSRVDCMKLPQDQKRLNAQNIGFFALDAYVDPALCKPGGGKSGAKSGVKSGAEKTSKRFDAIHQRRAGRQAAGSPGANNATL